MSDTGGPRGGINIKMQPHCLKKPTNCTGRVVKVTTKYYRTPMCFGMRGDGIGNQGVGREEPNATNEVHRVEYTGADGPKLARKSNSMMRIHNFWAIR